MRFRLVSRAALFSCALVLSTLDAASEEAATRAEEEAASPARDPVRPTRAVQEGGGYAGFGIRIEGARLELLRCDQPCPTGVVTQVIELPEEIAKMRFRAEEVVAEGGARVLFLRWGTAERYFAAIARGPRSDAESETPRLLLKGWAGPESPSRTDIVIDKTTNGRRLLMASAPTPALCGRTVPTVARVLEPQEGKLRTVRLPALSATDREQAPDLRPERVGDLEGKILVPVTTASKLSAREPTDLSRTGAWMAGYEFVEFEVPEGVESGVVYVELVQAPKEGSELYLVAGDKLYAVPFGGSAPGLLSIALPAGESNSCLALVQPAEPVPIAEVMLAAPWSGPLDTSALVARPDEGDPGFADEALKLRGDEAARAIAEAFPRMGPVARTRALEFAEEVTPGGAIVAAAAVEFGSSDQRTVAVDLLRRHPNQGATLVSERLPSAKPGGRARLVDGLVELDPEGATSTIAPLLATDSSAERLHYRRALAQLGAREPGRTALHQSLVDAAAGRLDLDADAQVELLRAAGPHLVAWRGEVRALAERLMQGADFSRAYRLLPHALDLALHSDVAKEAFRGWLRGSLPADSSPKERAALSVRALQLLGDRRDAKIAAMLATDVDALLSAENMRVRRAALDVMRLDGLEPPADRVKRLLQRDPWPEVRGAAALATVRISEASASDEIERALSRRLRREPDPLTRASVAEALGSRGSERSREALRRAFEKDEHHHVRAEAALSLGRLCDDASLSALTRAVRRLGSGQVDEGPLVVGLAAVTALARLAPPDLQKRIAPAVADGVSEVLVNQVKRRLEAVERAGKTCSR